MNERAYMLENEKISKVLRTLAVPATISMVVNAMYNIIDTIFIGRGIGTMGIAGVAVYLPIQMLMMAFAQMVGIGGASYVSRILGKKDYEKCNQIAGTAVSMMLIIGLCFTVLGLVFTDPILRLFGSTEQILPYAREYAVIMFIGVLFYPLVVMLCGLMRSEGNAKEATRSMIVGFVANIIMDYVFIFPLNMGIKGAALATTLAKLLQFLYIIGYLKSDQTIFRIQRKYLKIQMDIVKRILSVGLSAFVLAAAESIVAIVINHSLAYYGGEFSIAVYGIVYKVTLFTYMPIKGIMQGMQPIAGFNYGSKNYERVSEAVKLSILGVVMIAGGCWLVAEIFPSWIIGLFTNNQLLIDEAKSVLRIVMAVVPIVGIQFVGTTLYQSIGKAKQALFFALLRQVILFIPLALILPNLSVFAGSEIWGIWIAFPISDAVATMVTGTSLMKELRSGLVQPEL